MEAWKMMVEVWAFYPEAVQAVILSTCCVTVVTMGLIFWWMSFKSKKRRKTEEGKWQIKFANLEQKGESDLSTLKEKHSRDLEDIYASHRADIKKLNGIIEIHRRDFEGIYANHRADIANLEEVIAELKQKFGLYLAITNQKEEFENSKELLQAIMELQQNCKKESVIEKITDLIRASFLESFKQIKLESNYTILDKNETSTASATPVEEEVTTGGQDPTDFTGDEEEGQQQDEGEEEKKGGKKD